MSALDRLKDLVLGDANEAAAAERIQDLKTAERKESLDWGQRRELEDKEWIRLKLRVRQGLMAAGVLSAGAAWAWISLNGEASSSQTDKVSSAETESKVGDERMEMPITGDEVKLRTQEIEKWAKAMHDLAERTGNKHASEVFNYVMQSSVLGVPRSVRHKWAWQTIGKPKRETANPTVLMPLLAQDAALEGWERLASIPNPTNNRDSQAGAMFLPDENMVLLKGADQLSETWRGINGLHEGDHALTFNKEHYRWRDSNEYCRRERDTHEFQNVLMVEVGGRVYETALDSEKERMKAVLTEAGLKPGEYSVGRTAYDPRLDQAFGTASSTFEQDLRATAFWIHAAFDLIDDSIMDRQRAEEEKAAFYCTTVK